MPIWITESSEKVVIDMIADLNTSDGGSGVSSHPVSGHNLSQCFWLYGVFSAAANGYGCGT